MRSALIVLLLLLAAVPLAAQDDEPPSGLAFVERTRSMTCVGVLARVDRLDTELEPLAVRSRRLVTLSRAVALEERSLAEPLDPDDAFERRVRDWFVNDRALAQRYVNQPDPNLAAERAAGRETMKSAIASAIARVQSEADSILDSNEGLAAAAAPCDGAIFVREAVLEACATEDGPMCEEAALPPSEVRTYRFVDDPETMWDIQEMRPWTTPGPIRPGPTGQLDGARTIGYARIGNVVVSVAFSPLFRDRTELSPEELAAFQAVNDSLGLDVSHADFAITPSLSVRLALPRALAGEERYVVHFGDFMAPEVVWSGPASTGAPLETTVPLGATYTSRLRAGEPLSLTALGGDGTEEPLFTIQLSTVSQGPAVDALLRYMSAQLAADLSALLRARTPS